MKYKIGDICCLEKGKQIDTSLLSEQNPYKYINGGTTESGYYTDYNTAGFTITVSEGGASCGFVNYIDEPFWCGCHCYRLTNIKLPPKYVYYALKANQEKIMTLRTGTAMPNIKKSSFSQFEITLSENNEEQEKITNILDKVTVLIEQRQQQLETLDALVKSRFIEMFGDPVDNPFGWPTKSLMSMGYCKNGMNFHTGDKGIDIHCLGVGDFKDLSVIDGTDNLPLVSLNEQPTEECLLKDDDIVFVRSNGNKALVGRCLAVYPHNVPTTYSGFCIRYRRTGTDVETQYLLRALKMESMRKLMVGRGANIQNLNQQILAALDIPMPPMELQQQFAAFVQAIDKSKLAVQKSLDELETLKKALMQKYFS